MRSYLDEIPYIDRLQTVVRNFKRKDRELWNFACPICGDSDTDKTKARGYLFHPSDSDVMVYKCHNCGYSNSFYGLLGEILPEVQKELMVASLRGESQKTDYKPLKEKGFEKSLLDSLMDPIKTLPDDHPAVVYLKDRQIPDENLNDVFYLDDIRKVGNLKEKYRKTLSFEEDRIVFPFRRRDGRIVGFSMRALTPEASRRYIHIKLSDGELMVFGLDRVDYNEKIYVTEGQVDALMVPNAIAAGGSSLLKLLDIIPNEKAVIVFDNEPYNKEICAFMKKMIDRGLNIVIMPSFITSKDLNKMVCSGEISRGNLKEFLDTHTYNGARALLEYNRWKK